MRDVFITKTAAFLPNGPVDNERMEGLLGKIAGRASKARRLILESNRIQSRYYALDHQTRAFTHSNAALAAAAISNLVDGRFSLNQLQALACATTFPDQFVPSHASMVHGLLKNGPLELASLAGVCLAGVQALKYAFLGIRSGEWENCVAAASELASASMLGERFEEEMQLQGADLQARPYLAFEKDFLRWMLSDGAGAFLLQAFPNADELSLKIDWVDVLSYSHQYETCMYGGAIKGEDGELTGYRYMSQQQWQRTGALALKQDVKLLNAHVVPVAVKAFGQVVDRRQLDLSKVDYFLPHLSSYYFFDVFLKELKAARLEIDPSKWFTNLQRVGNIGSASIFIMLDELFRSGSLRKGDKILLFVPESARFSMGFFHLTVV